MGSEKRAGQIGAGLLVREGGATHIVAAFQNITICDRLAYARAECAVTAWLPLEAIVAGLGLATAPTEP